ncbi:SDR family oxidoreductase [Motilimonas eburnea]|uniref:SDR family oxidoreductase n=1 Tax=Motilimonas eburnea TaxID=1737488 RepID=UPI001E605789|nr:SDR family oxidoreductase [Motilimonas eburnea]MCE2572917.1 SDR family oxidoreductase [Motilimonas eburnea]
MTKTLVITGANRGIGLALAQLYQQAGWQVIGVCRQSSSELDAIATQVITNIDVTSEQDVARMAAQLKGQSIDLLINNAGLLADDVLGDIDFDNMRRQMEINAYAPLRVTQALLDKLVKGSKIGNITSRMGSIADNDSGGRYGYRASKAALNAIGKSMAQDLKQQGIAVAQLHPGWVKTRMVGFGGLISPEQSALGLKQVLDQLTLANSGGFWHTNGEELPW